MGEHSKLLSPSASPLWLKCTAMPQALIDNNVQDQSGVAADRGTLQHEAAEDYKVNDNTTCPEVLDSNEWDEVIVAVDAFDDFLKEEGSGRRTGPAKGYRDYYELRVGFEGWREQCFGTCDRIRIDISVKTLYIMDYKFGRVGVEASTPQLKIYGLAAIDEFKKRGVDISKLCDNVVFVIAQPKVRKKATCDRMSMQELLAWDEDVLQPAQKAIIDVKGVFTPGSHCKYKYCKFARDCTAAKEQMEADMDDFMDMYSNDPLKEEYKVPATTKKGVRGGIASMSVDRLAYFLEAIPLAEKLFEEAKTRALTMLSEGEDVPRHKRVHGRGKREWIDEIQGERFLRGKIKVEDMFKKSLMTAPQAETALKKAGKFEHSRTKNAFDKLIVYKEGSIQLAHDLDPRSAVPLEIEEDAIDDMIDDMFADSEESTEVVDIDLDDLLS